MYQSLYEVNVENSPLKPTSSPHRRKQRQFILNAYLIMLMKIPATQVKAASMQEKQRLNRSDLILTDLKDQIRIKS
ncbi:hypothetical protein CEXT_493281 [Caerostris extrusa]|uniref:Uncharacterized protein n=1 Tax=Caerostris extrusa TaxID=172846 RepID=A0AAV4XQ59_CAEEX|nr:hypothetical protein CEXT_493281 [Caerostris extrusa]